MIKNFIRITAFLMFAVTGTSVAQMNVAYMNTQQVINQLPQVEGISNQLNKYIQQKQQVLQDSVTTFQNAVAQYQKNQSSMSDNQQQTREQQLSNMENNLQNFRQNIQVDIQRKRSELMSPIYNKIDKAIADIAKKRGYDLVLNEATASGESIIFFASQDKLNITQEVLEQVKGQSTQN